MLKPSDWGEHSQPAVKVTRQFIDVSPKPISNIKDSMFVMIIIESKALSGLIFHYVIVRSDMKSVFVKVQDIGRESFRVGDLHSTPNGNSSVK